MLALCNQTVDDSSGETQMPPIESFMKMRKKPKLYGVFCKRFLKCVVGDNTWKANHLKRPVEEFVTNSDEAFALVTLENNYKRWSEMHKTGSSKQCVIEAKYTNSGESKKDGKTKEFSGWSEEGIKRFNELHRLVKLDRKGNADFGNKLLSNWVGTQNEDKKNAARANNDNEEKREMVTAAADFPWDDAEDELDGSIKGSDQAVEEDDEKEFGTAGFLYRDGTSVATVVKKAAK